MKKKIKGIFFLLIIICSPSLVFAEAQIAPRLITVTGDAEVMVDPDEAILFLGVETWNSELNVAKAENDQRVQKIFDLAKKYKIEEKYIQTDHISIEPRYEDQYNHRKFMAFFVNKSIVITIKNISQFENILSDVLEAGVNYVHGVHFRTTALRKIKDQARALAIKAAQEKAQNLANELGQKIGNPYTIQESASDWWSLYNARWGNRSGGFMAQNVVQHISESTDSNETIAVGQIKVNAEVIVSFELE